jgi:hypothetical protein
MRLSSTSLRVQIQGGHCQYLNFRFLTIHAPHKLLRILRQNWALQSFQEWLIAPSSAVALEWRAVHDGICLTTNASNKSEVIQSEKQTSSELTCRRYGGRETHLGGGFLRWQVSVR